MVVDDAFTILWQRTFWNVATCWVKNQDKIHKPKKLTLPPFKQYLRDGMFIFTLGSSYENGPLLASSGEDLLQHTAVATDLYRCIVLLQNLYRWNFLHGA